MFCTRLALYSVCPGNARARNRPILHISFRVTSLALGQSYDCPSANEATLKDMGKQNMRIHQEIQYKQNKTVRILYEISRVILWMHPANERRRYIVTSSLTDRAHSQIDPRVINRHILDIPQLKFHLSSLNFVFLFHHLEELRRQAIVSFFTAACKHQSKLLYAL